jgi:hypothetical protein
MAYSYPVLGYYNAPAKVFNKEIDFDTDDMRIALVTNAYVPDRNAHSYWTSVVANELANGNGYTTNGLAIAGRVVTVATTQVAFKCTNPAWTFTAAKVFRYAVLYDRTPATDATRPLICYWDFGTASLTFGNPDVFTMALDATNGLFRTVWKW